jgi:16S rRNA (cytosine967-C5)-methyltransferase
MADLPERLRRAGARAEILSDPEALARWRARVDLVVVDAPCSGSGSWRRDPAGKWRLTPQALVELAKAQRDALGAATGLVRPGGAILYATCSLLRAENAERLSGVAPTDRRTLTLTPADGADGFFAARWIRASETKNSPTVERRG